MTEQREIKKRLEVLEKAYRNSNSETTLNKALVEFVTLEDLVEAIKALEKQIAKKPKHVREEYGKHNWRKGENGKIDLFAWEYGFCNGPVCEQCGETPCMHCNPNYDDEKCVNDYYICPECFERVSKLLNKNYCQCGQRLEWVEG